MKKVLVLFIALLATITLIGNVEALSTTFDFENVSNLNDYLDTTYGSNVTSSGFVWYENSSLFGSDVLYASYSGEGVLDFDPLSAASSSLEITSISFTWGVYDGTTGYDFVLDVYDDTYGWRTNIFTRNNVEYQTGSSGLITFNPSWQVTRLSFHDSGLYDIGIDNLTVNDNRVPEPATMLLFGSGLLGMGLLGRRRFKK